MMELAGLRMVAMVDRALDALEIVLDNPGMAGSNVKRLAARDILTAAQRWISLVQLDERVTELERLVGLDDQ